MECFSTFLLQVRCNIVLLLLQVFSESHIPWHSTWHVITVQTQWVNKVIVMNYAELGFIPVPIPGSSHQLAPVPSWSFSWYWSFVVRQTINFCVRSIFAVIFLPEYRKCGYSERVHARKHMIVFFHYHLFVIVFIWDTWNI